VVFFFQTAYAIGLLAAGQVMDWLGTRKGFSLSVIFWSIAAMGHALASSVMSFSIARFALGLGEAGNLPASIKTVAEWFPKKERALATGIFNAGTNVGILVAAAIVPPITLAFGWKWAFVITGLVGFVWLAFWLALYRRPEEHQRLSTQGHRFGGRHRRNGGSNRRDVDFKDFEDRDRHRLPARRRLSHRNLPPCVHPEPFESRIDRWLIRWTATRVEPVRRLDSPKRPDVESSGFAR
jgi:MFS family permease